MQPDTSRQQREVRDDSCHNPAHLSLNIKTEHTQQAVLYHPSVWQCFLTASQKCWHPECCKYGMARPPVQMV